MDEQAVNERKKYDAIWNRAEYQVSPSPGLKILDRAMADLRASHSVVIDQAADHSGCIPSFIDFGCGGGQVINEMARRGVAAVGIDISTARAHAYLSPFIRASLWDLPFVLADFGLCCDVMEHIPTDRVHEVLQNIRRSVRVACFFQIAMFPDHFGPALIGESLHLTVQPPEWWFEQFRLSGWLTLTGTVENEYLLVVASKVPPTSILKEQPLPAAQ